MVSGKGFSVNNAMKFIETIRDLNGGIFSLQGHKFGDRATGTKNNIDPLLYADPEEIAGHSYTAIMYDIDITKKALEKNETKIMSFKKIGTNDLLVKELNVLYKKYRTNLSNNTGELIIDNDLLTKIYLSYKAQRVLYGKSRVVCECELNLQKPIGQTWSEKDKKRTLNSLGKAKGSILRATKVLYNNKKEIEKLAPLIMPFKGNHDIDYPFYALIYNYYSQIKNIHSLAKRIAIIKSGYPYIEKYIKEKEKEGMVFSTKKMI